MIFADKILISLFNSNNYSNTLMNQIVSQKDIGEDVCELESKFILLRTWINILQQYYDTSFAEDGSTITPAYPCLTAAQAEDLVAKLKIAVGNNHYPITSIFALGLWWEEYGFLWNDSDTWYDSPNLV